MWCDYLYLISVSRISNWKLYLSFSLICIGSLALIRIFQSKEYINHAYAVCKKPFYRETFKNILEPKTDFESVWFSESEI